MPETYSAKQVAVRIGTDPKTLRKFLRSSSTPYEAVGQGGRYEFPRGQLGAIKKDFIKWQQNKRPATVPELAKPAPTQLKTKADALKDLVVEVITEDDDEPTAEELDEIAEQMLDEDDELEVD